MLKASAVLLKRSYSNTLTPGYHSHLLESSNSKALNHSQDLPWRIWIVAYEETECIVYSIEECLSW